MGVITRPVMSNALGVLDEWDGGYVPRYILFSPGRSTTTARKYLLCLQPYRKIARELRNSEPGVDLVVRAQRNAYPTAYLYQVGANALEFIGVCTAHEQSARRRLERKRTAVGVILRRLGRVGSVIFNLLGEDQVARG